jgi:hypothetical protein
MNSSRRNSAHIRHRLRRSADILVDDAGLRSNLTDAQAKQLLDWGLGHVKRMAQQTARLSDEDAYPALEEMVTTVRRIMRLVNRLMKPPAATVGAAMNYHMTRLLMALPGLTGRDPGPALLARAETFTRVRPDLDDERAFHLLMGLIDHRFDETGEEE